jgi:hypothetical protein
VDVVLSGHIHSYERTHPTYNGSVAGVPVGPGNDTYVNPPAPLYVVQGTSGALPENVFFDPPPAWSAARVLGSFGYGVLALGGGGAGGQPLTLRYEFRGLYGELLDAWGINKTAPARRASAPSPAPAPAPASAPAPATAPPPAPVFSLLEFGGVGDGVTDNAAALTAGVAAVAAAGGGVLYLPGPAVYLSGPFNLTSRMTLLLGGGAVLRSTDNYTAWPLVPGLPSYPADGPRYAPFIGGVGLGGVRVAANGTGAVVDGQGAAWAAAGALHLLLGQRPHAIELNACTDVEVTGFTLLQAAFWGVHPVYCTRVHVHDLVITSDVANSDGVDPDGCADVVIERVAITTADDAVAIKSGNGPPGAWPASTNVTVRDAALTSGEGCVAVGSECTGGVRGVRVGPNVTCSGGHGLLYVKQRPASGGTVADVAVDGATLVGGLSPRFLWLTQEYGVGMEEEEEEERGGGLGTAARGVGGGPPPAMANISVSRVGVAHGTLVGVAGTLAGAAGSPGPGGAGYITNVTLADVDLGSGVLLGWTCANVSGSWLNVTPPPCPQLTPAGAP